MNKLSEKVMRNRRKKRDVVNAYKSSMGCMFCRESDPCCLDFHHNDPEFKEYTISNMMATNKGLSRIESEIEKCSVVCRNCHAKIHAGRLSIDPA